MWKANVLQISEATVNNVASRLVSENKIPGNVIKNRAAIDIFKRFDTPNGFVIKALEITKTGRNYTKPVLIYTNKPLPKVQWNTDILTLNFQ